MDRCGIPIAALVVAAIASGCVELPDWDEYCEAHGYQSTYYRDRDRDGYGDATVTTEACTQPEGYIDAAGDCDDTDSAVHPGAEESCNETDDDCDGTVDDGVTTTFYLDRDADGYGDPTQEEQACNAPKNYVDNNDDCSDSEWTIHPGAAEQCDDGVDQDCDGTDASCSDTDDDGDGYTDADGDCDDADAATYPGASEICDGADNNCNGAVDEGLQVSTWYADVDDDGYGNEDSLVQACGLVPGVAAARGDCDDENSEVYPGAVDTSGDGVDADCGGTDAADPHVGLNARSYLTIQAALDTVSDGQTVWVGPGTYVEHGLTMEGKAIALRATHGEDETVIDGNGEGTVFYFTSGEGAGSVLSGFSIANGEASTNCRTKGGCNFYGGGLFLDGSSPTLTYVTVTGNSAEDHGGGMFLNYSDPVLDHVTVTGNSGRYGGGLFLEGSNATLTHVTVIGNSATDGGGMCLNDSSSILTDVTVIGNSATDGGGLRLYSSLPTLTHVTVSGNSAEDDGGGMYLYYSSPRLTHVTVTGNTAEDVGGGMYLYYSDPTLTHVTVTGNTAEDVGGGMYLFASSPTLTHVTVTGNTAEHHGGGMFLYYNSSPTLTNVILAYNIGLDLWATDYSSPPTVRYCALYSAYGPSHNLDTLDTTNLEVDPAFVAFTPDGDPTNDDLHLRPGSPLIDAGALDEQDPDGTRADIGVYGGPDADWSGYEDQDGDGLYDAWETAHGMDPAMADGEADLDGDGVTNLEELSAGTDPQNEDSDADGYPDGSELEAGTDALDSSSQPGQEGLVTLHVPGDYPTIQDAIDAVGSEGRIEVAAGTYPGLLRVVGKGIELVGVAGSAATVLDGEGQGTVVTVLSADLVLEGFAIRDGAGIRGGGLFLSCVEGRLDDLVVEDNFAHCCGGMSLWYSSPTLTHVTVSGNSTEEYGGGMYLGYSSPSLTHVTVSGNSAEHDGGGMVMYASAPTLTHVTVSGNSAGDAGGGIYVSESSPTLTHVTVSGNSVGNSAGGMLAYYSDSTLTHVTVVGNSAGNDCGGMSLLYSSPRLTHVTVSGNFAEDECGGMFLLYSSPSLTHVTVSGNSAGDDWGGMYLCDSSSPRVRNSLIAYNTGSYNVYQCTSYPGDPTFSYCDVYDPDRDKNVYNITLDASNLTVEPRFLDLPHWDVAKGMWIIPDQHLALDSPLIDAGDPGSVLYDPDGSRVDIGIYGGPEGDGWDRDGDGYHDYFWPGTLEDAPEGFDPADWDADDWDPDVH